MLAVYVVLLTVGVVLTVPAVVRAADGLDGDPIVDGAGFTALCAAIAALFARQVGATGVVTVIVAAAVGLAAGVMSPEALTRIRARREAENPPTRIVE